jgi:hypothetical protein
MSGHPIKTISLKREMFVRGLDEQRSGSAGGDQQRDGLLGSARQTDQHRDFDAGLQSVVVAPG